MVVSGVGVPTGTCTCGGIVGSASAAGGPCPHAPSSGATPSADAQTASERSMRRRDICCHRSAAIALSSLTGGSFKERDTEAYPLVYGIIRHPMLERGASRFA